ARRPAESDGRERLAALLGGDAGEERARPSLRQASAALRRARPRSCHSVLIATTDSLALDANPFVCGLARFRQALESATRSALQEAAELYRGDLLDGFDARSGAVDEWLTNERMSLRRQATEACET